MTEQEARDLTLRYLRHFGLPEWHFRVGRAVKVLGVCLHGKRTIQLNRVFFTHATDMQVLNTVLHEIAHALVGPGHGHGQVWKAKALEIGCNGLRLSVWNRPDSAYRYKAVCAECGKVYYRLGLPRKKRSCWCGGREFNPGRVLVWQDNRVQEVAACCG